jgi:hypothetical protein
LTEDYQQFLESKRRTHEDSGFDCDVSTFPKEMFPFQIDACKWALKKGKSALFLHTGLGKTICQLTWANEVFRHTGRDVLILAPLAVASQTVREGQKFGIEVNYCRAQSGVKPGVNITNYEMLDKFDPKHFIGICLDEGSILKSLGGAIKTQIIESFWNTPYRLSCTATPSPNDYMELGNQAEFLGVMKSTEMLSTFFVHDGGDTAKWRVKGHANKGKEGGAGPFWIWVASWAIMMKNPRDLGYDGDAFDLPPLNTVQHTVSINHSRFQGRGVAKTLTDRGAARRESLTERCEKAAELANNSDETWLVWCDLNDESSLLTKLIPGAVEVRGSDKPEYKERMSNDFCDGKIRVLVSKPSIFGAGLNYQHCHNMIFVGLSDSFEALFQAVRRCWRFGQTEQVNVHVITSEAEGAVVKNIKEKEKAFDEMLSGMIAATSDLCSENIRSTIRQSDEYNPQEKMVVPGWL